ncbi:hypothetical protein BDZ89DRAFT_1022061 [Hymenopellis radicata]|nr:hypothetical protein BDZ89DRAFT_1022061 [Hymenopellis radicata]
MMPNSSPQTPLRLRTVALFLTLANVVATVFLLRRYLPENPRQLTRSWRGDDFPEFWDVPTSPISLIVEESAHYDILYADAKEEWATNAPYGKGYVRSGPEYRVYALDLFHQIHCLRNMRLALATDDHTPKMEGHIQHCLNFIRMLALCNPNLTLEPADVLDRDFETERVGATHVCTDWREYYKAMRLNWEAFDALDMTTLAPEVGLP